MDLAPGIAAVVISLISLIVSISRKNDRRIESEAQAMDLLARKYASLGWAYSKMQADSSDPVKARKHALEGFIIADTSADGKRDFTDKQAGVYVDGCKHE
jgi:hypothetical protein